MDDRHDFHGQGEWKRVNGGGVGEPRQLLLFPLRSFCEYACKVRRRRRCRIPHRPKRRREWRGENRVEWRCSVGEREDSRGEGGREIEKFFCIISRDEMYEHCEVLIAQIARDRNQNNRRFAAAVHGGSYKAQRWSVCSSCTQTASFRAGKT